MQNMTPAAVSAGTAATSLAMAGISATIVADSRGQDVTAVDQEIETQILDLSKSPLSIDEKKIIEIKKGSVFKPDQKKQLLKKIKENNLVILMEDPKAGDLSDFAAVSPEGKYVLVKFSAGGRTQHVTVINEENTETIQKFTARETEEEEGEKDEEKEEKEGYRQSATERLNKYKVVNNVDGDHEGGSNEQWRQYVTLNCVHYSRALTMNDAKPKYDELLRKKECKAFCTIHIELYATKNNKWIKFRLTDAVGMKSRMGCTCNAGSYQGFFNHSASIYIFPTSGSPKHPHSSLLPPGWCRPYMEPRTENSATKYTSTTGWSVTATAGVEASTTNTASANVTAGYHNSQQVERSIPEFKICNVSDGSMTGWHFYYTVMDGENWKKHFHYTGTPITLKPKPITDDLARNTLTLNAECVYEGPASSNELMEWNILFEPNFAILRVTGLLQRKGIYLRNKNFPIKAKINMAAVH